MKTFNIVLVVPLLSILGSAKPFDKRVDYPENARLQVTSTKGNGCPGDGTDRFDSVYDYMGVTFAHQNVWTYGLNLPITMTAAVFSDGRPEEKSRRCAHTWKFINSDGYRMVINKNGTAVSARYKLPAGQTALWTVKYDTPTGDPITEQIRVNGPKTLADGGGWIFAPTPSQTYKTECGVNEIKMSTSLELVKKEEFSSVWSSTDSDFYMRLQQALSFQWEKC